MIVIDGWFYNVIVTVLKKKNMYSVYNSVDHECHQKPCCRRQGASLWSSRAVEEAWYKWKIFKWNIRVLALSYFFVPLGCPMTNMPSPPHTPSMMYCATPDPSHHALKTSETVSQDKHIISGILSQCGELTKTSWQKYAPKGTVYSTESFPWHTVMLWWPTLLPKLGAMGHAYNANPFKLGAWGRPGSQGDLGLLSEFKSCCFYSVQWLQLQQLLSQPAISTPLLPVAVRPQGHN